MATLADLQDRLARVRSKERGYVAIQGICRVVVALIVIIIAYFLIDWIVDLPYTARLIAASVGVLAVGYVFYRYIYVELRRIQDDDEMALRVEARNPDLRGRLISTLQLIRSKGQGAYVGSNQMISALEEETVRMSDPLDFSVIVSTTILKRVLIAAAIVIVVKAALIFQFPDHFRALAERLIHPEKQYPTKTRIKDIKVPEYVARGEDIPVEIILDTDYFVPKKSDKADKADKPAGMLYFLNTKSETNIPIELPFPASGEVFKGKLAKALEDVDLVVEIGDVRTKRKPIKVVARPEVDTTRSVDGIRFTLPAYTEEPPPAVQKFGAVGALQSSVADLKFTATKQLKSAVIERLDGRKYPMTPVPPVPSKDPQVPTEPERMTWTVSGFPVDKSGTFHVTLVDDTNLTNSLPALEYPIDARPDLVPMIKLMKPTRDQTVTPTARMNVRYNARDDYGIRVVWLCYKIKHETAETEARSDGRFEDEKKIPIERKEFKIDRDENKKIRRELTGATITFDMAEIKAKVGDQVIFWLECDDMCDTNDDVAARKTKDGELDSKYPRTQDVKFTVISRQDKEAELRAELAKLMIRVEQHAKTEEEDKVKVLLIMEALESLNKTK
ncbi:MAG: DUF4175 family protein [Planctomycetota bacterium]